MGQGEAPIVEEGGQGLQGFRSQERPVGGEGQGAGGGCRCPKDILEVLQGPFRKAAGQEVGPSSEGTDGLSE